MRQSKIHKTKKLFEIFLKNYCGFSKQRFCKIKFKQRLK